MKGRMDVRHTLPFPYTIELLLCSSYALYALRRRCSIQLDGAVTLPLPSPFPATELQADATLPLQRMTRVIPLRVCFFHFSRIRRPLHRESHRMVLAPHGL